LFFLWIFFNLNSQFECIFFSIFFFGCISMDTLVLIFNYFRIFINWSMFGWLDCLSKNMNGILRNEILLMRFTQSILSWIWLYYVTILITCCPVFISFLSCSCDLWVYVLVWFCRRRSIVVSSIRTIGPRAISFCWKEAINKVIQTFQTMLSWNNEKIFNTVNNKP